MAFSVDGLNAALAGITVEGTHLSLHDGDPGTTGANEDTAVPRLPADWQTIAGAEVDSTQVPFAIPPIDPEDGPRTYSHFGVWTGPDVGTFISGGELDQAETFSPNGGTYNFTATATAASAPS